MTKEENEKRLAYLKNIVLNMPELPGSYQFYDSEHQIIYVGKAKKLKSRVSTYFHKEVDRFKTKVLVSKIHDISYTVVKTEEDALLLENVPLTDDVGAFELRYYTDPDSAAEAAWGAETRIIELVLENIRGNHRYTNRIAPRNILPGN